MTDFFEYVCREVQSRRLTETDAAELIMQFREGARHATPDAHPLLHRNTSDLDVQRFSSVFSGEEFFFRDHVVGQARVLPAAAHLEMAQAAVTRAVGTLAPGTRVILEQVTFARPVIAGKAPLQVDITLARCDDGSVEFEIAGAATEEEGEPRVHSRGRAACVASDPGETLVDLTVLKQQCQGSRFAAEEIYAALAESGLAYGAAFRGLRTVQVGRDAQGRLLALAEFELSTALADADNGFIAHPSVVDVAMQAAIGLSLSAEQPATTAPALPFALDRFEVHARLPLRGWVVARLSPRSVPGDASDHVDLQITDERGCLCLALVGLSRRSPTDFAERPCEILLMRPRWREQLLSDSKPETRPEVHLIVFCEVDPATRASIEQQLPEASKMSLESSAGSLAPRYVDYAAQLLTTVRERIAAHPHGDIFIQVLLPPSEALAPLRGLSGFLKSAAREDPRIIPQVVILPVNETAGLGERLLAEFNATVEP
ncbi:MAG: polyketide synthase dehydratase domain-containing protein, partial [Steroidobacteraceae bacterium]